MNRLQLGFNILRYLGPRIVWLRAETYAKRALGTTRRHYPPTDWSQIELARVLKPGVPSDPAAYSAWKRENAPPFFFPLGQPPQIPSDFPAAGERQPPLPERIALLRENRTVVFFKTPTPGPVDWNRNPLDGRYSTPERTWSDIPDFLPFQGDMRGLWDPSRAAWAFDLARAHARDLNCGTGFQPVSPDAAELFWRWVESWMAGCLPWRGFQWKCGQESSVRILAIIFAAWALAADPALTPQRWQSLLRLVWATGYRVAHHIQYAVSQKNNHALSEAMGLMLIGQTFPELAESESWLSLGRRTFASELPRQVYPDGTYVQHSMNYQRVMLHDAILCLRLAEIAGAPFERALYDRVAAAADFIAAVMEPSTGRLPNYGNNEGALVLPLDECDYTDFRPVLQAAHFVAHRERRLESGPWDEDLLWLFGSEALTASRVAPKPPKSAAFPSGGYYTLRSADSWCMLRCHTYRDRPAHIDPLHLDLWWRGVNVLHDPGTYYYYTPDQPELERYFKSITAHNTIAIDDAQPVEWVSRFLCFPWPTATLLRFDPALNIFEGEHTTYNRRPWHCKHRRCVIAIAPDIWLVIDDIFGRGHHTATLRWHAPDFPHEFNADAAALTLNTPHGPFSMRVATESDPLAASLLRARKSPPVGFAAPYYAELQPALTLEALTAGPVPLRLVTLLCPGRDAELMLDEPEKDSQTVRVLAKGEQRNVRLNPPGPRTAIFALA